MTDFTQAWKSGKGQRSARISFATPELLWQVLTAKRWELLKALCGAGPVSMREAARRVNRDVKAVHGDITALLSAGMLSRAEGGGESGQRGMHREAVARPRPRSGERSR